MMLLWGEMLLGVWGVPRGTWMCQALSGAGGLAGGAPHVPLPHAVGWTGWDRAASGPPAVGFQLLGRMGQ